MYIFLYVLAGIVLLVVLLGIIAPTKYHVFREIIINKPKAEVFEHIKYLKKLDVWSPWRKKDLNMKKVYKGTDGEVGAITSWVGNKEVGEGEQEITKIIEGERVEGELRFFKPFKATSDCYFQVDEISATETKVTWGFSGKNKFPISIMMLFMNMDKSVGKDFEEGLERLKGILEG
ncbi:MAG: SRPBCC family protein [Cellulophaga sp.]